MNNEIKVSVIVPVYNVEKYIEKCLDSLNKQTLSEIEIIVIDDGSTDNSAKIIEKIKNDKIIFIKKENSGVSETRNLAMKQAKGEYIGFIDGDDYIEPTMYEKMYNRAKEEESDIVCCKYNRIYNLRRTECKIGNPENYEKTLHENPNLLLCGVPYIWNKIFKRSLIEDNNFQFCNYNIFEDLLFTYKCFLKANKISMVDEALYNYIRNRADSVTSNFSYKLFDIFDVMKDLINYYKEQGAYEEFEKYLSAVTMHHIFLRLKTQISIKEIPAKLKFLNKSFEFLDKNFKNWKKEEFYFEYVHKPRKSYTSKLYWISKLYKIKLNTYTKTKNYFNRFSMKSNKGAKYINYIKKYSVKEKKVLIDSQHGKNISGNMFYILKELYTNNAYKDYKIYVTVTKEKRKIIQEKLKAYNYTDIKYIKLDSNKYLKTLATSKFLFNDTSFMPYFVKREEQIYLNTWHGTPLKTLGKKVKNEYYNIGNLQKNFISADYLLYPSEYMMNHMLEDYMIDNIAKNKIMLTGYPRNTIFFDEERRKNIRADEQLENKEIIAYMPTWRGKLKNVKKTTEFIEGVFDELDKKLKENQILYVNFHPYLNDKISFEKYERIRKFPIKYETYDFLNICDKLITDYSSVFFDYAVTKRKIILFAYDEEEYFEERGVYITLDELPFPKVDNVTDLIKEINLPANYDIEKFIDEYCKYDGKDVTKKICSKIILGKDEDLKIVPMPNNGKKNVLIFGGNLYNCDTTDELFRFINALDYTNNNYYLTFTTRKVAKNKETLLRLHKDARFLGQLGSKNTSRIEKVLLILLGRFRFAYTLFYKKYKKIFNDERKRLFGNIDFDSVIVFSSKSGVNLAMFSEFNCPKELYLYSKKNINYRINPLIYSKYDKIYERYEEIATDKVNEKYKLIEK